MRYEHVPPPSPLAMHLYRACPHHASQNVTNGPLWCEIPAYLFSGQASRMLREKLEDTLPHGTTWAPTALLGL
jgi:hypothetical protein